MKEQFFQWLNWILMVNLFFVLFCFAWFAIALVGRSANLPLGLDLWHSLWTPVMQPAIGILMAGALISGASSWVAQKLEKNV
jgi:TRAP-type C4-dicarboxylate transport system permease small subunit